MLIDKHLEFSNAQALTATSASTNVVDTIASSVAVGKELRLRISIPTAFTGGTSVTFALQTDTISNLPSPTTLWSSGAIPVATLAAGYIVADVRVPRGQEQYLRVYYTVVGTPTAGTVDAFLVLDSDLS